MEAARLRNGRAGRGFASPCQASTSSRPGGRTRRNRISLSLISPIGPLYWRRPLERIVHTPGRTLLNRLPQTAVWPPPLAPHRPPRPPCHKSWPRSALIWCMSTEQERALWRALQQRSRSELPVFPPQTSIASPPDLQWAGGKVPMLQALTAFICRCAPSSSVGRACGPIAGAKSR